MAIAEKHTPQGNTMRQLTRIDVPPTELEFLQQEASELGLTVPETLKAIIRGYRLLRTELKKKQQEKNAGK